MAFSKESIQQMVALQKSDGALDKLRAEMDRVPAEISKLKQGLDQAKAQLGEVKNKILAAEKKKKDKELELAGKEEAIRKHSVELNQVKTNEAFKALQQEIEKARGDGGLLETGILESMEELDSLRGEEKKQAAAFKGLEAAANCEISSLEKTLADLKGRFDAAKAVRDQEAAGIPPDMMRVYEHIRSRGKLDAIVPVDGDNCSACRITLAPQMIIEVTKAKALVLCESCQRILYKTVSAAKAA